jgi:hypothetical protein
MIDGGVTLEQLARELHGRGYRYIDLVGRGEWALAVVDAFEYAVEHGVTIEPELRQEAKRLLFDGPVADPDDVAALTEAIAKMEKVSCRETHVEPKTKNSQKMTLSGVSAPESGHRGEPRHRCHRRVTA